MAETALGFLLGVLRDRRGLSLREVGLLAGIDHAYIHRLESGAKESPSKEVLARLVKALRATKRETEFLEYLAAHPDADAGWVGFCLNDQSVTYNEFVAVAAAVFRGAVRPDYAKRLELVRSIMEEEGSHG